MGNTQRITKVQTFCSIADFTKARKSIEMKMNTFLFMYMNSRDVIMCYSRTSENSKCFLQVLGIRDIEVCLYIVSQSSILIAVK